MNYQRRNGRSAFGGVAFLIFLGLAFLVGGKFFLPLMFVGLAFASLLGASSSGRPGAIYGGMQGFVWMLGIGFCFLVGWWPWILFVVAASMLLGMASKPVMAGIGKMGAPYGMDNRQQQVYYQPSTPPTPPPPAPTYQPYDQGYRPAQETSEEGGKEKQVTSPAFDQPQAQYPQPPQQQRQELPPQQ